MLWGTFQKPQSRESRENGTPSSLLGSGWGLPTILVFLLHVKSVAEALHAKADTSTLLGAGTCSSAPQGSPSLAGSCQWDPGMHWGEGAQSLTPEEPELKIRGQMLPGATVPALGAFSKHVSKGFSSGVVLGLQSLTPGSLSEDIQEGPGICIINDKTVLQDIARSFSFIPTPDSHLQCGWGWAMS